jgi:hypothetical protein
MKTLITGFNLNEKGKSDQDKPGSIQFIYFFSSVFFASSFFSCLSSLRPFTAFTAALPALFFQKLSYRILLLQLFNIIRYSPQYSAFFGGIIPHVPA